MSPLLSQRDQQQQQRFVLDPWRRRCVPLFVCVATILLILAPLTQATSDKTVKRRLVRNAREGEDRLEAQHTSIEEQELAQSKNASDGIGADYHRAMDEILGTDPVDRLGAEEYTVLRSTVNITYQQCVHHMQRWLKLHIDPSKKVLGGTFNGTDGKPAANVFANQYKELIGDVGVGKTRLEAPCGPSRNCSSTANPCGLQYVPYDELFSGMDQLILIGDSTILRDFKFIQNVKKNDYLQKVADLTTPHIQFRVKLSSGRIFVIHFFRLLYASMLEMTMGNVFDIATPNSAILMSLGPHDTSWLIFDRQTFINLHVMPGMQLMKEYDRKTGKRYKQSEVLAANIRKAKDYWERWIRHSIHVIGNHLRRFEARMLSENNASASAASSSIPPFLGAKRLRPFIAFREHFNPKCSDPKYANRPQTRCVTLLKPSLVPYMRAYLRSHLALLNIPVIGMDALTGKKDTPCYLIDAGHLPRACKSIELQLFIQSYRLARRLQIRQGYPYPDDTSASSAYGSPPNALRILDTDQIFWRHLSNRITRLRPRGFLHRNTIVRYHPTYTYESLMVPPPSAFAQEEVALIKYFDDQAFIERRVDAAFTGGSIVVINSTARGGGDFSSPEDSMKAKEGEEGEGKSDGEGGGQQKTSLDAQDIASTSKKRNVGDVHALELTPLTKDEQAHHQTNVDRETVARGAADGGSLAQDVGSLGADGLGVSTFHKRTPSQDAHRMGLITLFSFFSLTAVIVLLWQRVD